MLEATKHFIALRHANEALRTGDIRILDAHGSVLAFERKSPGQTLLCIFNLGAENIEWPGQQPADWRKVESLNQADDWTIGAYGALVLEKIG